MNLSNNIYKDILSIEPLFSDAVSEAWVHIDNLTKPIGSLGYLEEIGAKIAGIKGFSPNKLEKKSIIIMCADNGVVEEGVSTCPQSTTAIVTENFTKDITGVYTLSKFSGSDLTIVDVGVNYDFNNEKIIDKKISYGTKNIVKEAAMSREQAIRAIEIGIDIVKELKQKGYEILGTGEMGIGNTTTSAATFVALTGMDIDKVVGKGAGITEIQYENKKNVVKKALEKNAPDKNDVIDVLSKVGGYDIAALCGCFIGAAKYRIPIVIDGFIASVAALCAYKLNKYTRDYMFPSHLSAEPGAIHIMKELGLKPMLNLDMRLGEGSGCPLAFNIIDAAIYTINNMGTFEKARLEKTNYVDIREKEDEKC